MKNLNTLMKRVGAYMIDILVIMVIASILTSIPFLQKDMNKYEKELNEYTKKYTEIDEFYQLLNSSYEDSKIDEEEYNKLLEKELYQDILTEQYEDEKISQGEYKKIITEIEEDKLSLNEEYNYRLGKIAVSDTIITLVCTLLYFGIFQYLLKGQTIGKRILKLKVVSASDKKINILNFILRSLIINNVLLNTISVLFLILSSQKVYIKTESIISTLVSVIEAIVIFLVMTREDSRGLHDIMFNTKVISTEIADKESTAVVDKKEKVIEAKYKEKNKK